MSETKLTVIDFFGLSSRSPQERLELLEQRKQLRAVGSDYSKAHLDYDYFDNPDNPTGYRGYHYDGRFAAAAAAMVHSYGLQPGSYVVSAGRTGGAGGGPGIFVDSEGEATGVQVVGDRGDPLRELDRVGDQLAGVRITMVCHPAVVDIERAVAELGKPVCGQFVGRALDQLGAHRAAEVIPTVPAHRRRQYEACSGGCGRPGAEHPDGARNDQRGNHDRTDDKDQPSDLRASYRHANPDPLVEPSE